MHNRHPPKKAKNQVTCGPAQNVLCVVKCLLSTVSPRPNTEKQAAPRHKQVVNRQSPKKKKNAKKGNQREWGIPSKLLITVECEHGRGIIHQPLNTQRLARHVSKLPIGIRRSHERRYIPPPVSHIPIRLLKYHTYAQRRHPGSETTSS